VVVVAWFTVWLKGVDVLFPNTASPLYAAVIEYFPAPRVRVVRVAVPCEPSEAVPRKAVPFLNVTVPVGRGPVEVTVAVNVTGWP
jgi:hypothetical protein